MADVWYYSDKRGPVGPFTLKQLKETLASIPNPGDLLVWRDGFQDWQRVGSVRELSVDAIVPPPLPSEKKKMASGSALPMRETISAQPKHTVRTEKYRRGPIGTVCRVLFIIFNVAMALWLISYWVAISGMNYSSQAEKTGATIGAFMGTGVLFFFWAAGAVVLGLLTFFTRGQRIIVEDTISE